MANARRGLRGVKTMAGLSDRRRSRSTAGALMELSVLANEKERLGREIAAAERRGTEVQARLAEIAEKEGHLKSFIKDPPQMPIVASPKTALPPRSAKGVNTKEICY